MRCAHNGRGDQTVLHSERSSITPSENYCENTIRLEQTRHQQTLLLFDIRIFGFKRQETKTEASYRYISSCLNCLGVPRTDKENKFLSSDRH